MELIYFSNFEIVVNYFKTLIKNYILYREKQTYSIYYKITLYKIYC